MVRVTEKGLKLEFIKIVAFMARKKEGIVPGITPRPTISISDQVYGEGHHIFWRELLYAEADHPVWKQLEEDFQLLRMVHRYADGLYLDILLAQK